MSQTRFVTFSLVAALALLSGIQQAAAVIIDFEAYADGQNLNGVNLGGVTFTAPAGVVEVYDNRFGVSFNSPTKAIANLNPSPAQDNPLVGVFDLPTNFVSLWGGDVGGDTESWELSAYDAAVGGNLLGTVNSGAWIGSPYRQLSITAPGILRIEARHFGSPFGMGFDDLEFRPIPEPATWAVCGLALAGLCGWQVRRKLAA
jgi:hypothetical protein